MAGLVTLNSVQALPTSWLWADRIPMGMVTVLAGDAKAGKSLVTCKIAATVSRGQQFPFTEGEARRGHVVLINAEDDAARILRPRLEAAGADLQRIHIPAQQSRLTRRLTLDALRQELRNIPHLRLVILDPVTAVLPVNRNNADQVREVLTELAAIASSYRTAIIAVVHLNKSKAGGAKNRISGSFEWLAACRAAFLVTSDPMERRLFLPLANNLGKRNGLAFRIGEAETRLGPAPVVRWQKTTVSISADEALSSGAKKSPVLSEAAEFLRQTVTRPMLAKRMLREGKLAGFSTKELRTARQKLKIGTKRVGGLGSEGRWAWFPPAE